ncbi:ComF family protein [Paenibacillus sp. SI8]|uniref:ComF family protein n=1 Tax=unclassified Paenibacillus TaxID=185978 RepID=UPI003465B090
MKAVIGQMLVHAYQLLQVERASSLPKNSELVKEIITFVPVSDRRMQERGFNQAEQMAVELGRRVGLPVVRLLNRAKHTDKQSFKKRSERIDDLAHVFEVVASIHSDLREYQGATIHIYVVDDVYTTGSTMNQCSKALKDHVSANIYGLTWAR